MSGTHPQITLEHIRAAVALPDFDFLAAQLKMSPEPRGDMSRRPHARDAAVMVLVFPAYDSQWRLVLTRRTEHLRGHSGQISFPGGRRDPHDTTYLNTALRETWEELGIVSHQINIIGQLSPIYIPPSNYNVYPSVGFLSAEPEFIPNPDEVAEAFTVPVSALLDHRYKREEYRDFPYGNGTVRVRVPYYELCGHKVWGATATILSEFENRLHLVVSGA
jgi:8-oxo-dGTP pyrophosphatase MutT (NUDIX family)